MKKIVLTSKIFKKLRSMELTSRNTPNPGRLQTQIRNYEKEVNENLKFKE